MLEPELRGWLPVMGVHLDETVIDSILQEWVLRHAAHTTIGGKVVVGISAHVISARNP